MRKANEHGLKPYDGRVCTVYNPFHGRAKEVHDSGCKGQEQETWFLFDESRKFGNEVASILIVSDVSGKNAKDVTEQIKVRESTIRKVHKKIVEQVVLECLLHLLA